jgi:integrase
MRFNISIYPDNRYDTEYIRFFMQLSWPKARREYGKIIRELPDSYSVSRSAYNRKRRIIDGKDLEATTIRDRHFKLRDFVNNLSGEFDENLKRISEFAGVNFEKWIGVTVKDVTKAVTLRDYIARYLELKGKTISSDYRDKFDMLIRNLNMFMQKHPVGNDNLRDKDEDQQKVFFSKYVTFLTEDIINDKKLGIKGHYENASVKEEFRHLTSVCNEFKGVGLMVNLASFVSNLRTPSDSSDQPHVSYDEILAILKNIHLVKNTIEEKAIYISVFQYFTGIRHNELYQVEDGNITVKMLDGVQFKVFNYISDKTGKQNTVPLNNICLDIISHWSERKFKAPKSKGKVYPNCLLPVLTVSGTIHGFRSFLKRIPKFCDDVKRIRYRGTERVEQVMPRWKRYGTHAFRHGYSAYLSGRDVSIEDIGQLLNHGSGSKTTRKHYQHIKEDKVILQAFKLLEKAG